MLRQSRCISNDLQSRGRNGSVCRWFGIAQVDGWTAKRKHLADFSDEEMFATSRWPRTHGRDRVSA